MAAVRGRSYHAGLTLFTTAQCLATNESGQLDRNILMAMLYPTDSHPDASPLHMLCCNDTCSFTWTGREHINQDIFECRTCGLMGTLCCCTECARVCHRGHDCKYVNTAMMLRSIFNLLSWDTCYWNCTHIIVYEIHDATCKRFY